MEIFLALAKRTLAAVEARPVPLLCFGLCFLLPLRSHGPLANQSIAGSKPRSTTPLSASGRTSFFSFALSAKPLRAEAAPAQGRTPVRADDWACVLPTRRRALQGLWFLFFSFKKVNKKKNKK
jgi:hypothetical protein